MCLCHRQLARSRRRRRRHFCHLRRRCRQSSPRDCEGAPRLRDSWTSYHHTRPPRVRRIPPPRADSTARCRSLLDVRCKRARHAFDARPARPTPEAPRASEHHAEHSTTRCAQPSWRAERSPDGGAASVGRAGARERACTHRVAYALEEMVPLAAKHALSRDRHTATPRRINGERPPRPTRLRGTTATVRNCLSLFPTVRSASVTGLRFYSFCRSFASRSIGAVPSANIIHLTENGQAPWPRHEADHQRPQQRTAVLQVAKVSEGRRATRTLPMALTLPSSAPPKDGCSL